MQPFKERQIKPYQCLHCPKSFKSSNGLKYHSEKVHFDEENKMELEDTSEIEGTVNLSACVHQPLFPSRKKNGLDLNTQNGI